MPEETTVEKIPCPKVITPTADDLEKIIIFIGNKYGWEYIEPLNEILGAFPLSHSWDGITLDIPELEWENKIQAIIEEFKLGYVPWKNDFYSELLKKYSEEEINLTGLYYKSDKTKKYIDRFNSRIIFPVNNISGDTIAFGGNGRPY